MSRSRKRNPISKVGGGKAAKKAANHKVRRQKTLTLPRKSNLYRRFSNQYDVIDYRFYLSKRDAGDEVQWWAKSYYRK